MFATLLLVFAIAAIREFAYWRNDQMSEAKRPASS